MEKIYSVEESDTLPCTWYAVSLFRHHWVDTVDGYQRCANCKNVRVKPEAA